MGERYGKQVIDLGGWHLQSDPDKESDLELVIDHEALRRHIGKALKSKNGRTILGSGAFVVRKKKEE